MNRLNDINSFTLDERTAVRGQRCQTVKIVEQFIVPVGVVEKVPFHFGNFLPTNSGPESSLIKT